jgi:hypothetical protein
LNEDFPAYHLCTAQTFHSNFTLRLKKKLVGFSHYGHFSSDSFIHPITDTSKEAIVVQSTIVVVCHDDVLKYYVQLNVKSNK